MTPDLSHFQLEYLHISCYVEDNQYQENFHYDLPAIYALKGKKSNDYEKKIIFFQFRILIYR